MEMIHVVERFSALASPARLAVFRLLVQAGPGGVRAGEVAEAIAAAANTTSNHLAVLSRAGLIQSRRDGRSIVYSADYEATRDLIGYLIEDCCAGRPEVCVPMIEVARRACCVEQAS